MHIAGDILLMYGGLTIGAMVRTVFEGEDHYEDEDDGVFSEYETTGSYFTPFSSF